MLGMIGTVMSVRDEDLVLTVDNRKWLVNSAILTLHEAAPSGSHVDLDGVDNPLESIFKQQLMQKVLSDLFMGGETPDNDDKNNPEGSALVKAVSHGHLSRAKQILKTSPELVNSVYVGKTSLHLACHNGYCDIIKLLLETPNCDMTIKDSQGYLAIHHAAYGDKSGEAMKLMLAHGGNPNTADNENKCTPLHLAVKETNISAVKVLVQADNCDVNLQDSAGDSPLHHSIILQNNAILDLLLEAANINLNLKNEQGFNCLHLSAITDNSYAARKLLSKSPELLNVPKEDGLTALHLAAAKDHREIAEVLLEHPDCDVECVTKNHQTPLMFAAHEGYLTMVQILEQKGANVNAKDEDGNTPLHLSLMKEKFFGIGMGMMLSLISNSPGSFSQISRYLISHGADVRQVNNMGRSPMDFGVGTEVEEDLREAFESTKVATEVKQEKQVLKIVNQFHSINTKETSDGCVSKATNENIDEQANTSAASADEGTLKENKTQATALNTEETQFENAPHADSKEAEVDPMELDDEEFQNGTSSSDPAKASDSDADVPLKTPCLICEDQQADVVFEPCGHCIMCTACSRRAKRCLDCKKEIRKKIENNTEMHFENEKDKIAMEEKLQASDEKLRKLEEKLEATEKKLRKLEESVTCCVCMSRRMNMVFACGHGACQVCTEQLRTCAICKKDIEKKIAMF